MDKEGNLCLRGTVYHRRFRRGYQSIQSVHTGCIFLQVCPVRKYSRIKPGAAYGSGRSQRPAVRAAFRAFWGRGKGFQNCSEILSGYQIRRHFGTEKPLLASGLPKSQLFQGIGTASIVLSQALSAEKARFSCSRKVRDCVCALSKFWATHIALGPPAEGKIGPVPQEKRL